MPSAELQRIWLLSTGSREKGQNGVSMSTFVSKPLLSNTYRCCHGDAAFGRLPWWQRICGGGRPGRGVTWRGRRQNSWSSSVPGHRRRRWPWRRHCQLHGGPGRRAAGARRGWRRQLWRGEAVVGCYGDGVVQEYPFTAASVPLVREKTSVSLWRLHTSHNTHRIIIVNVNHLHTFISFNGRLKTNDINTELRWSPTDQSTAMLFSSWARWAAGDWWRRPGNVRASSFLFQRISVAVQRFNSVLLHYGFIDDDRPE